MPNGHDRNWMRFCAAVNGFRNRFGRWPSSVRLASKYVDDLRALLSDESFGVLEEKLALRIDERAHFIAEDEVGNKYDYRREGFLQDRPEPSAEEWLGVHPEPEF